MSRFLIAVLALLLALPGYAQNARAFRDKVEASMVVTGHVDIGADGSVTAYALDAAEKLPGYVVDLFDRNVPGFRFEPPTADGEALAARARMSARIVARKAGEAHEVSLRSVHFSEVDGSDVPKALTMQPPRYPPAILRAGGQGTVYLILRLDADGAVRDVAVEQVNLTVLSNARTMDMIRGGLAQAASRAARDWRFEMPARRADRSQVLRIPVSFVIGDEVPNAPATWSAYLPGPYSRPEWAAPTPQGFAPDALAGTHARTETSRFRVLTPLEG